MLDSQILKNIIDALINNGIRRAAHLAEAIDYDQGNLSKILNGKKKIPAALREKLQIKYGIRQDYFIAGEGEMFQKEQGPINKPDDCEKIRTELFASKILIKQMEKTISAMEQTIEFQRAVISNSVEVKKKST